MPKIAPIPLYFTDAQIKILQALATDEVLSRNRLAELTGFSAISGTIQAAMNGTRGATTNMIEKELVEVHELDLDGLVEINYRLTDLGRKAVVALTKKKGG